MIRSTDHTQPLLVQGRPAATSVGASDNAPGIPLGNYVIDSDDVSTLAALVSVFLTLILFLHLGTLRM